MRRLQGNENILSSKSRLVGVNNAVSSQASQNSLGGHYRLNRLQLVLTKMTIYVFSGTVWTPATEDTLRVNVQYSLQLPHITRSDIHIERAGLYSACRELIILRIGT
ncbi:hypothetical protein ElyMa_000507000 [Elysia marginata]|uniref:Uncharacterized protein n=1 Tax=Elysia marginata TaxID=1093978 RepID=A0AAV4FVP7_9GAST|nr:hypothetical protein ElyMa_000507000 [Elysia marginata]